MHVVHHLFHNSGSQAALLIDSSNVFHSINQQAIIL